MRGLVKTEKSVSTENLKDYSGKFVYNSSQFNANEHEINKAFTSEYSNFQLAYSIKSNYSTSLLKDAQDAGLWLEVASLNEVDKALSISGETQLILTCPFISDALLSKAFENNIIINVDSIEQLARLAETDLPIKVSLRLNFPVEGLEHSRFGIDYSKENIGLISEIVSTAKLQLVGVHCHFTTKGRTIKSFEQRTQKLAEAFKVFRHFGSLEYINIGGGFFGKMPDALKNQLGYEVPGFRQYAVAITNVLNREFKNETKPKLIIEPGAALSANCFTFVAEVLEIKKGNQRSYAVLNTSNVWLKPTKHALNLSFEVHNLSFSPPSTYTLVANNCMENDMLGMYNGVLNTGDFVVFNNVGAYASSFGSEFIVGKALTVDLD